MIEIQFYKKINITSKCPLSFGCPDRNHKHFFSVMLQVGLNRRDHRSGSHVIHEIPVELVCPCTPTWADSHIQTHTHRHTHTYFQTKL